MIRGVAFVIKGEPASKSNSRQLVNRGRGGRPMLIKSKKAREYEASVKEQVVPTQPLLEGPLVFTADVYYKSRRPDLDESIILDALQGIVYKNDRQVVEKHVRKFLDKDNPRAHVQVEMIDA